MNRVTVVVLGVLVAVTGCALSRPAGASAGHRTPVAAHGTVRGRLLLAGMSVRPVSGRVVLAGPRHYVVTAGPDGSWTAQVVPGTYLVAGTSPKYDSGSARCHASAPVAVTAGTAVRADVQCIEK